MSLIEILEKREGALDVRQVAELLKVSERHIYELAAGGTLPAFRVGKAIRFDPHDVADWLRKKKPVDNHRKPQKAGGPRLDRNEPQSVSPDHIWRKRVASLEAALAMDSSSDGDFVRDS